MMDTPEVLIRFLHASSGTIVLLLGIVQALLPKGGPLHRLLGRIYLFSWTLVFATGIYIGSLLIAFFAWLGYYQALTGTLIGRQRSLHAGRYIRWLTYLGLLSAGIVLVWALKLLLGANITFGVLSLFFGGIFLLLSYQDYRIFILGKVPSSMQDSKGWYRQHFTRMYVSMIAATTAFSAIQQLTPWPLMDWMLPTLLGTSFLIWLNKKHRSGRSVS